jgi:formate dehydrogenase
MASSRKLKIVAVLYEGGEIAAKEPRMLGCVENELGLREWLESLGHEYVVISDKEGENNRLDKELPDTDILISTPFHPAYLTEERIKNAPKLKLCITAGVGSDHINLKAANEHNITVLEVTGSNVVSVAEHVVMDILILVRNFVPAHEQIVRGDWNVAEIASRAFDLQDKVVGTVGAGRIGFRVLQRLKPFECKELLYFDYQPLSPEREAEVGARRVEKLEDMVAQCDVVTINCPLHEKSRGLFNKELLSKMKRGSYLVNTARGAIVERDALVEAVNSGHIAGYGGDVWDPQPAPKDHPWRYMPNNAMTPHYSGTTLDAQQRYAAGTKDILRRYFEGVDQEPENVIVQGGKFASAAYVQPEEGSGDPL